jgi:hypothetical protein
LAAVWEKQLTPAVQAVYFETLRDLPFDAVVTAVGRAAQTCTFFPKPAELRTLVLGDSEDHAEAAWLALKAAFRSVGSYASLATVDPALGETVVAMFGGWPEACAQELSAEMWSSKRKEFGRVYRVFRSRNLEGVRYLPGTCERQNAGQQEWMRFVTVGVIGPSGTISQLRGDQAEHFRSVLAARSALSRLGEGCGHVMPGNTMETA